MAVQATSLKAPPMDALSSLIRGLSSFDSKAIFPHATMKRLPEVTQKVGKKKSALYEDIGQGLFPPPVPIGTRAVAWPEYEIIVINAARITGMSDHEIRNLVSNLVKIRKSIFLTEVQS